MIENREQVVLAASLSSLLSETEAFWQNLGFH